MPPVPLVGPFDGASARLHRSAPGRLTIDEVASRSEAAGWVEPGPVAGDTALVRVSTAGLSGDAVVAEALRAILGAGVIKIPDLTGSLGNGIRGQVLAGSLAAAIGALISVRFLMKYFQTRTLTPFGIYCVVVGTVCAIGFGTGIF